MAFKNGENETTAIVSATVGAKEMYEDAPVGVFDKRGMPVGGIMTVEEPEVPGTPAYLHGMRLERTGERTFVNADGPLATKR